MAGTETKRTRIVVHGRVQGVFFRDSTESQARRLGLAGWVRNNDDGTVEAVFEGSPEDVEAAIDFCENGPERANVERVERHEEEPEGLGGFEVTG